MIFLLLLLQLTIIKGSFVNETIVNPKYLSNKRFDIKNCDHSVKEGDYVNRTLNVGRNKSFVDIPEYFNVSECVGDKSSRNIKRHILNGLIIHHDLPHSHWLEYKSVFNKEYRSRRQEKSALARWRDNLRLVAKHNRRFLAGETSYSLHLNQFGDWDTKDYFQKILKLFDVGPLFDPAEDKHKTTLVRNARRKVPSKVDWRAQGFKPKREEQWKCGACYAFAVTHALQAQLYKKHGEWGELSPQQIVDCSSADGNMGCNGGSLRGAMRYSARAGLIAETRYPYTGKKGRCKYGRSLVRAKPKRWAMLPSGDEGAIEKAVATIGPLAVAVNAAPFTFQLYRSGIYDDPFCFPWHLNHAMLLVGYTQQYWILLNWWGRRWGEDGYMRSGIYDDLFCFPWHLNHAMLLVDYTQQYWILLNWWGRRWGEDGYMRIRRGHNRCGIANMAAYVEL